MKELAQHEREQARLPAQPDLARTAVAERILGLQRSAGNRVVARMVLARKEKVLCEGTTGLEVKVLQSRLNQVDEVEQALLPDGIFGPLTRKAVVQFQTSHSLKPTGRADGETQSTLASAVGETQDQKDLAFKMFTLGAQSYERRRFGHAHDYFLRAEELAGEAHPALIFDQAQALRKMGGRRKEAIALYEKYLTTPDPVRKAEAEKHLSELRAQKTGDAKADKAAAYKAFEKGAAKYDAGDYGHALDEFEKAQELSGPEHAALIYDRAQALRRMGGRREEAIALYEAYLATPNPERRKDAEKYIKELTATRTGDEKTDKAAAYKHFEKGAGHYDAGMYGHAYDRFSIAEETAGDHAPLLFDRAQALRKLGGRRDEAIALFEAYLKTPNPERKAEAELYIELLRTQGAAL